MKGNGGWLILGAQCPKCNEPIKKYERFCSSCGTRSIVYGNGRVAVIKNNPKKKLGVVRHA